MEKEQANQGVEAKHEWVEPEIRALEAGSAELAIGPTDDSADFS